MNYNKHLGRSRGFKISFLLFDIYYLISLSNVPVRERGRGGRLGLDQYLIAVSAHHSGYLGNQLPGLAVLPHVNMNLKIKRQPFPPGLFLYRAAETGQKTGCQLKRSVHFRVDFFTLTVNMVGQCPVPKIPPAVADPMDRDYRHQIQLPQTLGVGSYHYFIFALRRFSHKQRQFRNHLRKNQLPFRGAYETQKIYSGPLLIHFFSPGLSSLR
jgi:hypothetical protein